MHHKARVLLSLCVITLGSLASLRCKAAQGDVVTVQIDAAAILQDPRLEKLVTLSARSAPLKAVLDSMASQTGVSISMDDRDPASGYAIFANYESVPAGTIMNALDGLLSIKRGEWAWTRLGNPGAYSYRLHETPWAKNRMDIYNGLLKGLLENYLTVMRKLTPMNMAERKLHLDELRKALLLDDPHDLVSFFTSEDSWRGAKFFFSALSQEQQDAVLAGSSISVLLKTLPPDVYDLYHQEFLFEAPSLTLPGAAPVLFPEPETVKFSRAMPGRQSGQVAPYLLLESSSGGGSWMGTGFLESGIRKAIKRAWMLPGDSSTYPAGHRVVEEVKDTDEIRKDKDETAADAIRIRTIFPTEVGARISASMPGSLTLGPRLEQLSAGSSTPVLAIIAPTDHNLFKSPVGKPMQEFLDRVEAKGDKRWYYKWRSGVLLVSHPYWFIESTPAIPYSLLSALHPDSAGRVPLSEWIRLMTSINDGQSDWFAAQYNVFGVPQYNVPGMSRLRHVLLFISNEPDIMHPDGVSAESSAFRNLQSMSLVPPNALTLDAGTRVRIVARTVTLTTGLQPVEGTALQIEVYDSQKNEWTRTGTVELPVYHDPVPRAQPVP